MLHLLILLQRKTLTSSLICSVLCENLNRFELFVIYSSHWHEREDFTMNQKEFLSLDEREASLALHAHRFYTNAKGFEISQNAKNLEAKLDAYVNDTTEGLTSNQREFLKLDELEASLALRALRVYMKAKGIEISQNTKNLEAKLEAYLSDATEDFTINQREFLNLDGREASLALHALRFYMNAKGFEISQNTKDLEAKLEAYLSDTTLVVTAVENIASILGARGGTKGGASTSEAKRAASAANGAKGGRPRKPNLFIRFHRSVWEEPDPKLLKKLATLAGDYSWLPVEGEHETHGPYVRMYVSEVSDQLAKLLRNSLNVWEWDEKPFHRFCDSHKIDQTRAITEDERRESGRCGFCREPANWVG